MGFEDFFENSRNQHSSYGKQGYYDDQKDHRQSHDSRHSYPRRDSHFAWTQILTKIRKNKKLKVLVIVAAIVTIALAIFLVIALLPLFGKILTYITQLDLKGLQEFITGLLDKLLKG